MGDGSNMKNFKIIFPLIDVSLMCSDDTIICSNTLTLSLDDVFSDINHPQVFLHIFHESYQECTLEDIRDEVPAPSIFHTPGRGHHTQRYFTSHYWQRYSEWEIMFCINTLYMIIFESYILWIATWKWLSWYTLVSFIWNLLWYKEWVSQTVKELRNCKI